MGSYFEEFTKAFQGDLRVNSGAIKALAGSSSENNVYSVLKHSSLQELVGTAFFSEGDISTDDVGGVAAAVALSRNQISSPRDAGVKKRCLSHSSLQDNSLSPSSFLIEIINYSRKILHDILEFQFIQRAMSDWRSRFLLNDNSPSIVDMRFDNFWLPEKNSLVLRCIGRFRGI